MNRTSRRSFLKAAGAVAASAAAPQLGAGRPRAPIGLQLYSVRDQLPKDFSGTLAQVHGAGYRVVEAAGYYGRTAAEFRQAMKTAGLRCVSTHHALSLLETQLDEWIDYGQTLGLEYIVCSSSGGMHRSPSAKGAQTLDDWHWIADEFNRIGSKVKASGMTFGVHNHTPEFAVIDGVLVYDELLRLTDPNRVVFEMDCGWVYASGHNPVDYLSKSPARFPLLHLKDVVRKPDGTVQFPVMGKGNMDYKPILRAATNLRYSFVEQERYDFDPMQELKQDADFVRKLSA
jgi:sugar phosphate isomerase/epimerase